MFCPKCGTKALEGAEFCQKCGAKIVYDDTAPTIPNAGTAGPSQEPSIVSKVMNNSSDIKEFVDNHVRTTTQYQSAEELLNSQVSLQFVWICLGISIVLGIWMGSVTKGLIHQTLYQRKRC